MGEAVVRREANDARLIDAGVAETSCGGVCVYLKTRDATLARKNAAFDASAAPRSGSAQARAGYPVRAANCYDTPRAPPRPLGEVARPHLRLDRMPADTRQQIRSQGRRLIRRPNQMHFLLIYFPYPQNWLLLFLE